MIAENGLWTDHPATNFVTVTFDPRRSSKPTPDRLARGCRGRSWACGLTVRSATTTRFSPGSSLISAAWQPSSARPTPTCEASTTPKTTTSPPTTRPRSRSTSSPACRFAPSCGPSLGNGARTARRLGHRPPGTRTSVGKRRSTASGPSLLGRPLAEPVDDLRAAPASFIRALGRLADDFAAHGYDLHRLIRTIAATRGLPTRQAAVAETPSEDARRRLGRLPDDPPPASEQVAGALFQCPRPLTTLGPQSHWFISGWRRLYRAANDFVRGYGDTGEDERFDARGGASIPQRLCAHERRYRS